ncbi:type II toxin-antitoxin system VapC family toxin [Methylobacter sp.]|uniref:type II toxin-antitoxin system VapC family toxin n=1 Tax=Methylobacter sp. TaxID=2051955 RepID=UPI0024887729|nr:type II toxin-antitoxin system VapC family toxin [Methylobacter sp.]MDI1277896.1 type II toxin-antitoxin system VapC family toxin [Methylobacter sp.]MDI1358718.1 type II toxin-antitoxin system VapC family toxin [Methylobacter sp.]
MAYLLDTNAAIALLKAHPQLLHHVRRVGQSRLQLCAPVEAELWFGVAKSTQQEQNRSRLLTLLEWLPSLPFAGQATRHFGDIRAHLASQGTPIGPYDLQIAAIAVAHDLTVVTHNTREFARVPGLKLEDWLL